MAAGSTYTPIISTTASGSTSSVIVMSSIPSTYTDLVLIAQYQISGTNTNMGIRFNNNATNYSNTWLSGSGSTAASSRDTNSTYGVIDNGYGYPTSGGNPVSTIIHINNYANTSVYKTALCRAAAPNGVDLTVNLWQNGNAISRIDILIPGGGGTIVSGSTFTLYGITAA